MVRGHRGNDVLIGGEGNDYLEGGLDDDKVFAGVGNDIVMEGAGNDQIDGGDGYDLVKYQGSYKDYKISRDGANYKIQDLKTGNIDLVKNIEGVRFTDITVKLSADNISPLSVADLITLANKQDKVFIAKDDLLKNDLDIESDVLTIMTVQNVVGFFRQENANSVFRKNENFCGAKISGVSCLQAEGAEKQRNVLKQNSVCFSKTKKEIRNISANDNFANENVCKIKDKFFDLKTAKISNFKY